MSLTSENLSSSQLPTLSTTNTTPSTSIKTEPETRLIAHKTRTYHLYRHRSIVYTWVSYLFIPSLNTQFRQLSALFSLFSNISIFTKTSEKALRTLYSDIWSLLPLSKSYTGALLPQPPLCLWAFAFTAARHNGSFKKHLICKAPNTKPCQVLFKRKPVQYIYRPAFLSDDSEAFLTSITATILH